jgi:hypothetical protein
LHTADNFIALFSGQQNPADAPLFTASCSNAESFGRMELISSEVMRRMFIRQVYFIL